MSALSFQSIASWTVERKVYQETWWKNTWPNVVLKLNISVLSAFMDVNLRLVSYFLSTLFDFSSQYIIYISVLANKNLRAENNVSNPI